MTAPEAVLISAVLAAIWLAILATWRDRRRQRLRERQLQFAREGEAGMMEQAETLFRLFGWSLPDIATHYGVEPARVEGWAAIWKWPEGQREALLLEAHALAGRAAVGAIPHEARTTSDVMKMRALLLIAGVESGRLARLLDAYAGQLSPFLDWSALRAEGGAA